MSAKVELKEGVAYGPGPDGRNWVKGIPQILADHEAINLYKSNSRFSVSELASVGKVKAAPVDSVVDETSEEVPAKSEEEEKEAKSTSKKDKKSSSKRKRKG